MSGFYLSQLGETNTGKDRLPQGQKVTWNGNHQRRDRQRYKEEMQKERKSGESGKGREREKERHELRVGRRRAWC